MTIKDFRTKRGETQEEFSRALDVTTSAVKSWEQGIRTPDRRSRKALERAGFNLVEYDREQKK